ncbi:MAG: ribokinase [Rubrobacteraceae bacterium]
MRRAGEEAFVRADVFVIGSMNRDFVLKVDRRPKPGETVTNARLSLHNGGKGANQSVAAARLGASVTFLGCVGDDGIGEPLIASLSENGVDASLVRAAGNVATGAAFITVTPDGENVITVAPGANRSLTPDDVDGVADTIRGSRVLVAQMEIPLETVERAVEVAASGGTRVLLNLAPSREVPPALLGKLDPLVVNEHEAAFLLGAKVEGAKEAASSLLSLGPKSAVVTVGASGAVFASGEADFVSIGHFAAPKVEVVDTTGAGDTFVGALAARLSKGDALPDAVSYAVRAGAVAVTKEGAQGGCPTPEEVENL